MMMPLPQGFRAILSITSMTVHHQQHPFIPTKTKTIQPRKPSRKMNKYEAYVTKEFITYFEGGDADKIVNSDEDQKANDEAILNTIKMAKEKLIQYEEERIPMLEQRTNDMKSKILKLQTELQTCISANKLFAVSFDVFLQ